MSVVQREEQSGHQPGHGPGHQGPGAVAQEGREVFVAARSALVPWTPEAAADLATEGVALPLSGEFVVLATEAGVVRGHWAGLVREPYFPSVREGRVRARILSGGEVVEHEVAAETLAASEVVIEARRATDLLAQAVEAVTTAHRRLDEQRTAGEVFLAQLAMEAHEEAENREWCSDFDDFMERVGLPRRTRTYECQVSVSTTVTISVEAGSAGEAERMALDRQTTMPYVELDALEISVEDVYEE